MSHCLIPFGLGRARVSRAGDGVTPSRTFTVFAFFGKITSARRQNQPQLLSGRNLICIGVLLVLACICNAQEQETETVVVSATRTEVPLGQSPASVSIISSDDLDQKQIERVSDALREVPGLNVVQTGAPGQLTSVFMRGLPSQDMQVLLDGIPINQGLAGQFDFANLTTD